jgi:hypothetical protein
VGRMRKGRLDMKIYKFRFTCDDYIYEVSADLQVEAETREEAYKKVMRLLYEEYPIAKTNNTASIKLMEVDCISEPKEPCEYCNPAFVNPFIDEDGLYLFIDKDRLFAGYSDECTFEKSESVKINYCPACGRKMEV